jgi:hypothetical protein
MPFRKMWELTPAQADTFAERYWSAKNDRLAEFYDRTGLPFKTGTRASLVSAMGWVIDWWVAGGDAEDGGEYPMWYLPPTAGQPRPDIFHAPALRLADALGYHWLDYVEACLPVLTRGRCDEQSLGNNHPVVWLAKEGNQACPFDRGYSCLLNIREDSRPDAKRRAGRDPEFLAVIADTWVASRKAEGAIVAAGGIDDPMTRVASGNATVDAELERLGLSWPLQTVYVDADRNADAGPEEPEELNVVFDDVAASEFSGEIDALVGHLRRHPDVHTADRHDREYILVELRPGVAADAVRTTLDEMATNFMRAALRRRYEAAGA